MMWFSKQIRRVAPVAMVTGALLGAVAGGAAAQQGASPQGSTTQGSTAQGASPQGTSPRKARTFTVRVDSSDHVNVTVMVDGLDSLMRSLAQSRMLEERIGMALREYGAAQQNFARRQALEEQLQKLSESNVKLMSRIQLACTGRKSSEHVPEGYLGVTFNHTGTVKREGSGPEIYRFDEPPEIVSIESGSPADRAGMRRGDRLVAFDNREVVGRDVILSQLLVPGRRLAVRVARDGREQQLSVLVQKRPESFGDQCTDIDLALAPVRAPGAAAAPSVGQTFTFVRPTRPRTASPATAPTPPDAPDAPSTPKAPSVWTFEAPPPVAISGFSSIVAGAQLTTLTDDFKELTGADGGVMIQRVLPETPAAAAGLRGGDVIVEAGDRPVMSARMLQRMISDSDEQALKLKVVRKGKARTTWLRW